jgi:hypothetical protein
MERGADERGREARVRDGGSAWVRECVSVLLAAGGGERQREGVGRFVLLDVK